MRKTIVSLFLIVILFSLSAEEKQVVVGGFPNEGLFSMSDEGKATGLIPDLFSEISMYAGWDVTYLLFDSLEGYAALDRGDIDILVPLMKTGSREKLYSFPGHPVSTENTVLVVSPDSPCGLDDYETIAHMKIAMVKGSLTSLMLADQLKGMGCEPEYIF